MLEKEREAGEEISAFFHSTSPEDSLSACLSCWLRHGVRFLFYLLSDAHVEVMEVAVASVGLPVVLATVWVFTEDGDGVERVGLPVIVTHA